MKRSALYAALGTLSLLAASCSGESGNADSNVGGGAAVSGGNSGAPDASGGSMNGSSGATIVGGSSNAGGAGNATVSGGSNGSGGMPANTTTAAGSPTGGAAASSGGASASGGAKGGAGTAGSGKGGASGTAGSGKGGVSGTAGAGQGGASGTAGAGQGGVSGTAGAGQGGASGTAGAGKGGASGTAGAGKGGSTGAGGLVGTGGVATGGTGTGGVSGVGGATATTTTPGSRPSAGCGKATTLKSGPASITAADKTREYILALPSNYDPSHAYKLVFAWHPWTGSAQQIERGGYYGLQRESNDQAIFVAGEGLNFTQGSQSGLGWGNADGEDVAFYHAMLDLFRSELCIDEDRIFSTGFSFGAMFSLPLGCTADSMLRAIVPMAGNTFTSGGCENGTRPVAVMALIGLQDSLLDGHRQAVSTYARRDECTTTTETMDPSWCDGLGSSNLPCTCVEYQGCRSGYPVISCEYTAGHVQAPNPGAIWDFIAQF